MMEKTVILIEPDGFQRGLVGEIMHRFERKELKLVGIKMIRLTDEIFDYNSSMDLLIYSKEEVDPDSIGVDK